MRFENLLRVLVGVLAAVLVAPILIVLILSFSGDQFLAFPPSTLSLRWYNNFLGSPSWRQALWASLSVGLLTSLIATSVGFLGAYAFVRGSFRGKRVLLSLVLLPLIVPHIITAIALYFVSAPLGLVGSRVWLAICHATVALPIVVLLLMSALQGVDVNLERAALSLGASRTTVFRRIVLPLVLPGLLSAVLFSFLASFDELVIALFLAGISSETLPVRIWNSLRMEVEPTIAAVSAFFIGVTVVVLGFDAAVRRVLARSRLPAGA